MQHTAALSRWARRAPAAAHRKARRGLARYAYAARPIRSDVRGLESALDPSWTVSRAAWALRDGTAGVFPLESAQIPATVELLRDADATWFPKLTGAADLIVSGTV